MVVSLYIDVLRVSNNQSYLEVRRLDTSFSGRCINNNGDCYNWLPTVALSQFLPHTSSSVKYYTNFLEGREDEFEFVAKIMITCHLFTYQR